MDHHLSPYGLFPGAGQRVQPGTPDPAECPRSREPSPRPGIDEPYENSFNTTIALVATDASPGPDPGAAGWPRSPNSGLSPLHPAGAQTLGDGGEDAVLSPWPLTYAAGRTLTNQEPPWLLSPPPPRRPGAGGGDTHTPPGPAYCGKGLPSSACRLRGPGRVHRAGLRRGTEAGHAPARGRETNAEGGARRRPPLVSFRGPPGRRRIPHSSQPGGPSGRTPGCLPRPPLPPVGSAKARSITSGRPLFVRRPSWKLDMAPGPAWGEMGTSDPVCPELVEDPPPGYPPHSRRLPGQGMEAVLGGMNS